MSGQWNEQDQSATPAQLHTRLMKLWGMTAPIVGAPMAGRAGGLLARAVSEAGGLGMFGATANATPEWIAEQAALARQQTQQDASSVQVEGDASGRFGIGLMLWAMEQDPGLGREQWAATLEARPSVVSLGFGDASPYVDEAHAHGISVVQPVNSVAQVKQALAAGVDALCVQGVEAGGHTGQLGLLPLLQLVLDYVEVHAPGIPVAAAGGIASGRGVASVLAAGADAAWVGTALLASPEALGSAELRAAAVAARSSDTVLTDIYDIAEQQGWDTAQWPTRTVRNGFVDAFAVRRLRDEVTDAELIAARAPGGAYAEELKLHAGQAVGLLRAEVPAGDVVRNMTNDAISRLGRVASLWK